MVISNLWTVNKNSLQLLEVMFSPQITLYDGIEMCSSEDGSNLDVVLLHKYPEYLTESCNLINREWKRSDTARLRSLESSCDSLPTSIILLKEKQVIGHCKLTPIPSIMDACFVESVVIDDTLRGKGYGSYLMKKVEEYCKNVLNLGAIYLSTKGQEMFYGKLGYNECAPISIYGSFSIIDRGEIDRKFKNTAAPTPPPLPKCNHQNIVQKTFMNKVL